MFLKLTVLINAHFDNLRKCHHIYVFQVEENPCEGKVVNEKHGICGQEAILLAGYYSKYEVSKTYHMQ
jgi:hypothetical protein